MDEYLEEIGIKMMLAGWILTIVYLHLRISPFYNFTFEHGESR